VSQYNFQDVPCVARAKKNSKLMCMVLKFCVHNVNFIALVFQLKHRISNSCTWGFDNALTTTVIWECLARLTLRMYAGSRLPDQKLIFILFFYWDIYDCHKCPNKKLLFFKLLFLGSGSLDPAYVHRVKRAGGCEKYCSSNVKNIVAVSTMHLAKCMNF
jgi:hypothetical protein